MESSDNKFNVAIIGAGGINFGTKGDPWNHTLRLERKLGSRLNIIAVIDPDTKRANAAIKAKEGSLVPSAYANCVIFKSLGDFSSVLSKEKQPNLIVVGCPPQFRGGTKGGQDLELQLLKLFPGVPLFIEKPVTSGDISESFEVAKAIKDSGIVHCVGYMLRYLGAVQMMKRIIEENQLTVVATVARYASTYASITSPFWWNKSMSGGPIVEQATHFCDISRYFGGDVDLKSIQAQAVEWNEVPGKLSKVPVDESQVPPEERIPRVTSANWKYQNGAVGTLTHLITLQGIAYSCEFEVFCDGYLLKLLDPYNKPVLHVRRPGSDAEEVYEFKEEDPFLSEFSNIVDVIEKGNEAAPLLSTYEDACKTYEFSWMIRKASEKK